MNVNPKQLTLTIPGLTFPLSDKQSLLRIGLAFSCDLLFLRRVKQFLFEFSDARVIVSIADNPVHAASYVAAADVANDGSIGCSKTLCAYLKLIVVFDGSLDATIGRYLYSHLRQKFSRTL